MIRKLVECDRCGKQNDLPVYVMDGIQCMPDGFYRVGGGGEERHFCSRVCIRRYYSSNDEESKGETGCLGL